MKHLRISVIMSTYNSMPFLKEAVISILNQSFRNLEFIVVDDASSDQSLQFLNNVKDKRLVLIKNKKNLGLAASLNLALSKAKGEYIVRMDADDISKQNRFKTQLEFMESNPKIDICGSYVSVINQKGETIGHLKKPASDKEIKKQLYWLTPLIHPTWFAKRKVFDTIKGYDEKWDYVEDFDFLIRAKKFKMANIAEELVLWRSSQNRRSNKSIEKIYKQSLKIKINYYFRWEFGFWYFPSLIRSAVTAYLFPTRLKIYLNKRAGLI